MREFDYTRQARRPSAAQIVRAWVLAGRPAEFSVTYGETYATFHRYPGGWLDGGNGCRGVDRLAVVAALCKAGRGSK